MLPNSENRMILRSIVSNQCQRVTDRQTDTPPITKTAVVGLFTKFVSLEFANDNMCGRSVNALATKFWLLDEKRIVESGDIGLAHGVPYSDTDMKIASSYSNNLLDKCS